MPFCLKPPFFRSLLAIPRFPFAKKTLKTVPLESYFEQEPAKSSSGFTPQVEKYEKKAKNMEKQEKPVPNSPYLGAIEVTNPKVGKKYRWCACGMSQKQPFCDGKHQGTGFRPVRFVVQEEVKSIGLCGCKQTSTAPFCDKNSCLCLGKNVEKERN